MALSGASPPVTHPSHPQTPREPLQPQLRSKGTEAHCSVLDGCVCVCVESCDSGVTHTPRTWCSRCIGKRLGTPSGGGVGIFPIVLPQLHR